MINETKIVQSKSFGIDFLHDGQDYYMAGNLVGSGSNLYLIVRELSRFKKFHSYITDQNIIVKLNLDTNSMVIFSWLRIEKIYTICIKIRKAVESYLKKHQNNEIRDCDV